MKVSSLKLGSKNPRQIKDDRFEKLKKSIQDFPKMMELRPMVYDPDTMEILGGNMRLRAIMELGMAEVPDTWVRSAADLTEDERNRFVITDNVGFGEWDWDIIANEWDGLPLVDWGLELPGFDTKEGSEQSKKLSDRFIIPPFSVLDTKQGKWQQRKNYWLSIGIKSEIGRDSKSNAQSSTFKGSAQSKNQLLDSGVSIFDPVLCELAYNWFNMPNGKILDPFAGGSVRGIVAAKLGYQYLGNDLSETQILANRENANEVLGENEIYPTWTIGDSMKIDKIANGYKADMIFSCPPYSDLEVYSKEKEDISNMAYTEFLKAYREIIRKSCDMLSDDRFAVFVVGDIRDKKGFLKNFVSDTIMAFWNCGVILYNEMILCSPIGTVAMQTSRNFPIGRKVGKVHQNVLVFYKGDIKNIKHNYPELDLSYMNDEFEIE